MFDIHASTAHLHFQGIDTAARPIVIDAAELSPGKFEIMAMRPDGREIECQTTYTLDEAEAVYAAMLAHHTQPAPPPRPLSGKYAALRDARSRNAEAMTRALAAMGYDAVDYSQMD